MSEWSGFWKNWNAAYQCKDWKTLTRLATFRANIVEKREYDAQLKLSKQFKSLDKSYQKEFKEKRQVILGYRWTWLTINPPQTVNITQFIQRVKRYVRRSMFKEYAWAIEQRGTTLADMGKGLHVHALLLNNPDYTKSDIRRNTQSSFRRFLNVKNFNLLCCKFVGDVYANDKYNYLSHKTDEGKAEKQKIDRIFRKRYEYPEIFLSPNIIDALQKTSETLEPPGSPTSCSETHVDP